jgi:macrolide transport system ATP-binding/permease protein
MNPLTRFLKKLSILFRGGRFGSELEEEMAFHRALAEEELVASGMTPEAAHYAAMRQFGNETKVMEQSHEEVTFRVEMVVQDLRFALRQWRRNPGFALTAVLVLAPGMGVSVAMFGFVDAALLEPLSYANPDRLMSVNESNIEEPRWPLSYLDYLDWQRLNKSFSSLDVYGGAGYNSFRCGAGRGRARERQFLSDPRRASRAGA